MSREGAFLVYCIEAYKEAKEATGRQVYDLFEQYGVIAYVLDCYEALHTVGETLPCGRHRPLHTQPQTGGARLTRVASASVAPTPEASCRARRAR